MILLMMFLAAYPKQHGMWINYKSCPEDGGKDVAFSVIHMNFATCLVFHQKRNFLLQ